MKRIVHAGLLAASMLASGSSLAAACSGFTDVDDVNYPGDFCTGVDWMKNRGVTVGCAAGLYCPDGGVTRIQMAAFMKRLGDALTTKKLFTDLNPGFVSIQGSHAFVCRSAPYTPAYPQSATLHGLAWGLVNAPVAWSADVWYSTNGGGTYNYITNFIPTFNATVAGMTSGSTFAQFTMTPGTEYVFAILVRESIDVPGGTGNFTDLACHLMVEVGNATTAPPPSPCGGPTVSCGDAAAGSLGRNGR